LLLEKHDASLYSSKRNLPVVAGPALTKADNFRIILIRRRISPLGLSALETRRVRMNDSNSLNVLLTEEQELQFPFFNGDVAWMLGSHIHQRAKAGSLPIAIDISKNGQQLFFVALPGATPDNAEWIRRKRAVVQRFHHSSLYMSVEAEQKGRPFLQRYGLSEQDYAASGGGFPVFVKGTGCVGAVVVSGLPQLEDHRLVTEAIRATIADLTAGESTSTVGQEVV
jgi:uncharacterized protein (UPF0303 family)